MTIIEILGTFRVIDCLSIIDDIKLAIANYFAATVRVKDKPGRAPA